MSIHLNKPYKIVASKEKRYDAHYNIPSAESLIVPVRDFGQEVSCDIRWQNETGELQVIHAAMFESKNLAPLNPALHVKLFEIWSHYYSEPVLK